MHRRLRRQCAACPTSPHPFSCHELPHRLRSLLHRAFHQLAHSGHAARQTGRRALRSAGRGLGLPHLRPAHAARRVQRPASQCGDVWCASRWWPARAPLSAAVGVGNRAGLIRLKAQRFESSARGVELRQSTLRRAVPAESWARARARAWAWALSRPLAIQPFSAAHAKARQQKGRLSGLLSGGASAPVAMQYAGPTASFPAVSPAYSSNCHQAGLNPMPPVPEDGRTSPVMICTVPATAPISTASCQARL